MDKHPIRAMFNGVQQAAEPFELWTILEPIEGHPQYSTLSRRTIESKGHTIVRVDYDEEKIMTESRYHELLAAELRMSACGCGGVCRVCQNEPRPVSEDERSEFADALSARN